MRILVQLCLPVLACAQSTPSADEIVRRMVESDQHRAESLPAYTGIRRYTLDNERFKKHAEMTVRVTCARGGAKTFEILSESGPKPIRSLVLHKMLDAEADASRATERGQTLFRPDNYSFRLEGSEPVNGRPAYVLAIEPKTGNRYLTRGRIWIDSAEFFVVKVEGSPAKNPSVWTSQVSYVHLYEKTGGFWLPRSNRSRSEVRIFGPTAISIDYTSYQFEIPPSQ
jgi:hypothetical protein